MPLGNRARKMFGRRANFLILITYLVGALICWRLFFLGVIRHDFYLGKAEVQQSFAQAENIRRGEIYLVDREGKRYPLAINKSWPLAYAEPNKLSGKDRLNLATRLAEILHIDSETILRKISRQNDPFEVLKHKLSAEEADAINGLGVKGIGCKPERNLRYYPGQTLAAHVVGFLGYRHGEKKGQYGVEEYYNQDLSAKNNLGEGKLNKGEQQGKDLVLTIDPNVQLFVEERLNETAKKYNAESGTVIVMNPHNGKILAMANYPNFNPNQYAQVKNLNLFVNRAISESFEPGSVFKPIIMAIALQQGVVTPVSTYIDKGFVKIGGHIIENAEKKAFGRQTMTQVLEKSLNTGIVYVERLLKKSVIKSYLRKFGFGGKTGIDLPGEAVGSLRNLDNNRDINFATAAFGQGISVTAIQLLRAISTIANNGILIKPHIVERIGKRDMIQDELVQEDSTQVISSETANRLAAMLVDVTEKGTGRRAKIDNYWIATKTGTAQIPFKNKRGYSNDTIQTIVGFGPAYNAQFAVLAKLDRPQGVRFAAVSVAPLFKNISEYLLNYLEIPPERQ